MKVVKDHAGNIQYVQARHVSMVAPSAYQSFVRSDGEALSSTEIVVYGYSITVDESLESVIEQLGIESHDWGNDGRV